MPGPREVSIAASEKTTRKLKALFDRLGNTEHPRTGILSIYRQARRDLRGNLDDPAQVAEILSVMRFGLMGAIRDLLDQAARLGLDQARRELEAYELPYMEQFISTEAYASTILSISDAQAAAIRAGAISGMPDVGMLIGDDTRVGILNPNPVVRDGSRWLAFAATLAWDRTVNSGLSQAGVRDEYRRQAIAAIDERTTETCLLVHGQVTTLKGDFTLSGVPRFADRLNAPPFHWYCRTSTALVRKEETGDDLTQEMRSAASAELQAREEIQSQIEGVKKQLADLGMATDIRLRKDDSDEVKRLRLKLRELQARERVEIHPAHARSRR